MIEKEITKFPLLFKDNRIQRFYIGGKLMHEWRKMKPCEDSNQCEELLVSSIGAISKGEKEGYAVSKTIDEQGNYLLSEIIKAYPNEVLGSKFHEYNPNHLSVLARVGDTICRLVMQCHPTREDARKFFNMPLGKTEAWYMARTRDIEGKQTCVYAGFKKHVTKEYWHELFIKQDIDEMVNCLHQIPVKEGQTVLIPAGMPHCVGPGCLFLEYHECNDITVRVEKSINGLNISDEEMFYGLSVEDGLSMFDYTTYSEEEIVDKIIMKERVLKEDGQYKISNLIDESENDSFGIQLIELNGVCELGEFDGHRVLVAVDNDVQLKVSEKEFTLVQGHAALIPAACKHLQLKGTNCKVTIGIPYIPRKEGE